MDDLKNLYRADFKLQFKLRHVLFDTAGLTKATVTCPFPCSKRFISELPDTVETVFFGGMGEPLFHRRITDMVRLAAETVPFVELLTNGTLLTEEMSSGLLEAGLTKLWISIDSLDDVDGGEVGGPHSQTPMS
jgi:MoaA/NifB/PqqE/SkfB family radical SAM enzyme